ncbi:DUF166 family protein [Methanobrevibacter filiformis]|uniref:Thymidylate synthase n=1 Tax=Methanobrevibacter filiformis TaxID=55758 RepID=A0A166CG44_9EURY|nr:DUF166 family protein [Methanobrevibacter filiformis]KZX13987.1 hypothetical protein MBFIL_09520 [Methanobrevibacter filiformis]
MLKIIVVSDGIYGDRTYNTVKTEFETEFIQLEPPNDQLIDDEIEIPEITLNKLKEANIIISYVLHIDLVHEIVKKVHSYVDWIIVASWKGEGFKNQIKYDNVVFPYIMCDIEENGNPIFDEFAVKFGKPKVNLDISTNGELNDIKVVRSSLCGATFFVADFIKEKYKNKSIDIDKLPQEAGFKVQHYPCRAQKLRLFSKENQKELASTYHKEAFEKI